MRDSCRGCLDHQTTKTYMREIKFGVNPRRVGKNVCIIVALIWLCTRDFAQAFHKSSYSSSLRAKGSSLTKSISSIQKLNTVHPPLLSSPLSAISKTHNIEALTFSPPSYLTNLIEKDPHRTRWSVIDLSKETGVDFRKAEKDLLALAIITGAQLEVTKEGQILYSFPRNLGKVLLQRSLRHRFNTIIAWIYSPLMYLYRISFGIMLLSSLAVISVALLVAISSLSSVGHSDEDDSESKKRHHRRRPRPSGNVQIYINLFDFFDVMYIFDRRNASNQTYHHQKARLSFLRAIYSILFGEGDPNRKHDSRILFPAAVKYIQEHDGYVTAEELAMFAPNPPSPPLSPQASFDAMNNIDESFVLPFLLRYGGTPRVVDDMIIYCFPDLATMHHLSSSESYTDEGNRELIYDNNKEKLSIYAPRVDIKSLLEIVPSFSFATENQQFQTVALGCVNFLGVMMLARVLKDHRQKLLSLQPTFWLLMLKIFPLLDIYSVAFALTPVIRYWFHRRHVANVERRNQGKLAWFDLICSPSQMLKRKFEIRDELRKQGREGDANINKGDENSDTDIIYNSWDTDVLPDHLRTY